MSVSRETDRVYALFRRVKCTESSEIAAGVMPEMRDAWPSERGFIRDSFSRTSRESPLIAE